MTYRNVGISFPSEKRFERGGICIYDLYQNILDTVRKKLTYPIERNKFSTQTEGVEVRQRYGFEGKEYNLKEKKTEEEK